MEFTKQMYVVMETIWHLRTTTHMKQLVHTDVEKHSCNFSISQKPVSRQVWYSSQSRPEWQDIRKAIEGTLPQEHPVEQVIASFGKNDKTGMFATNISELVNENEKLKTELELERKNHQEFFKKIRHEQYEESHFRVNFNYLKTQTENLQKEKQKDIQLIQNYQAENGRLRDENKKLLHKIETLSEIENPRYFIFQPDIKEISLELNEKDLMAAYQKASIETFDKMKVKMKKKSPADIFLIFHSFNIDTEQFVENEIPFRFSDNNYVYSCCNLSGTSRKTFYNEISCMLELAKPTVILIFGKVNSLDTTKQSNLVELPGIKNNITNWERLQRYVEKLHQVEYDVFREGYEKLIVKRL